MPLLPDSAFVVQSLEGRADPLAHHGQGGVLGVQAALPAPHVGQIAGCKRSTRLAQSL